MFFLGFVVNDEPDVSYRVQYYDGQIVGFYLLILIEFHPVISFLTEDWLQSVYL